MDTRLIALDRDIGAVRWETPVIDWCQGYSITGAPLVRLIGHPSWRNEPSYLSVDSGKTVHVTNSGGRTHTFTEVANFGGGFVGVLNVGLTQALECNPETVTQLLPGATDEVNGLAPGLHKFQCCIHPWMRAAIRVN